MKRANIESLLIGPMPLPSVITLRPTDDTPEDSPDGTDGDAPGADAVRDDLTLPIVIGATEATSIAAAVDGEDNGRPLTHLFTADVVKSMGGSVARVVIDRVEGPVYYCTVYLRLPNGMFTRVDARPSDAIALAVRTNAPIFVEDEVIEAAGTPRSFSEGPLDKRVEVEEFDKFIEGVDPEDFVAFENQ